MSFRFAWFVLFISTCSAQNDGLEGSGEGSGEGDLLTSENVWQSLSVQQDGDVNDVREFAGTYPIEERCGVDLLFLLDTSGSLEQIYTQHINWTNQLVEALLTDKDQVVHIAVIQYGEVPIVEFSLGTYQDPRDITNHIMTIGLHPGGARTGQALMAANTELFSEEKGARNNASKIIVLFTDGLSVDDPTKHAEQLREVEKVKIYVVYIGSDGFGREMNRIAGGKSNVFGPHEFTRLKKILTTEVENAQTCETQKGWEIPTATIKTMTNATRIELSRTSSKIATSTKLNTAGRIRTSTTTYATSHKSLTKDTRLKNKSEKIPTKQITKSQDEDAQDKINNENSNEAAISVLNVHEQSVEATAIPQQSTFRKNRPKNDEYGENSIITPKFTKKLRMGRQRTEATTSPTNHSFTESRGTSRSPDLLSNKTTSAPRHVTVQRISNVKTSGKTGSVGSTGKNQEQCQREILFIVDSSGSMQRIYDQQKEYLLSLLNELQIGEGDQRVALIQFAGSSHQRVEWTFDTYKDIKDVAEALTQVRHLTGTTYIGRALENSISVLGTRRQGIPTIVILVSDGFSQDDASKPAEQIRRMPNVDLYAVSLSQLNNFEYLTKLTDDPSKVYVGPQSENLKQNLLRLIRCRT